MARHTTWPVQGVTEIPRRRGPLFEDTDRDERDMYAVPRGRPKLMVPRGSIEQRVTETLYDAVAGMKDGDQFLVEREHSSRSRTGSEFTMTCLLGKDDRFVRLSDVIALLETNLGVPGMTVGTALILNQIEHGIPRAGR